MLHTSSDEVKLRVDRDEEEPEEVFSMVVALLLVFEWEE